MNNGNSSGRESDSKKSGRRRFFAVIPQFRLVSEGDADVAGSGHHMIVQRNRLCDMGYYNDAMKGYCLRAAREMGLTEDQSRELLRCFGYALDVMDKAEAENLYRCTNG